MIYRIRIRGDRAQNLELAIHYFETALQVRTRTAFPELWAETQNALGNTYNDRIISDRADNVERAISILTLEVRTRDALPHKWAITQNNLGIAHYNRLSGDRAENLEQAIICYQNALRVRTRQDSPVDWAQTQNNLGNAYGDRIRGDQAESLELAISLLLSSLWGTQLRLIKA